MAMRITEAEQLSGNALKEQINRDLAGLDQSGIIPEGMRYYFEQILEAKYSGGISVESNVKLASRRIIEAKSPNQKKLLEAAIQLAR
jgi:hypothetical protein